MLPPTSWNFRKDRNGPIPKCPHQSRASQCLNQRKSTFVECERAFIFDNFREAISDAVVERGFLALGLESHLDDLEGLHHEDLRPSCFSGDLPATMPLLKAKTRSQPLPLIKDSNYIASPTVLNLRIMITINCKDRDICTRKFDEKMIDYLN